MSIVSYLILFFSVISGGLLFFTVRTTNPLHLKLALSFTGSFLFTISMVHLIPDVFSTGTQNIGKFILLGFFIQLILEYFSEGIEHGHIHLHGEPHKGAFPLTMMIGLSIHSFLEGMPLSGNFEANYHNHSLLTGIILHHLPVAFALVSLLSNSGISKFWVVFNLILFAIMAPAGAQFSSLLSELDLLDIKSYYHEIMAVVIGIFLHISTTILFESNSNHRFNLYKLAIILFGAAIAFIY